MPRTALIWVCLILLAFMPVLAQDNALDVTELATLDTMPARDFLAFRLLVAWSPDSSMLAVANTDHVVEIWDTNTGDQLAVLQTPFADGLAFSPNGQYLAVGGQVTLVMRVDKILEWETIGEDDFGPASQEGLFHAIIPLADARLAAIGFATDDVLFTYQALPSSIMLWDISEPMEIPDLSSPGELEAPSSAELVIPEQNILDPYTLLGRADGLYAGLIDRGDDSMQISIQQIVADFDAGIASFEPYGIAVEISGRNPPVISLSSDLTTLQIASSGSIQFFDAAESGEETGAMVDEAGALPVASPGGTMVAEIAADNPVNVELFDVATGSQLAALTFDSLVMRNSLVFSPDGSKLMLVAENSVKILGLSGSAADAEALHIAQIEPTPAPSTSDSTCDIDLSDTLALLADAQDAADAGDPAEAVDLMAEARANLEALETECAAVETSETELSQSFTLATEFGVLSFDYPGDWLTDEFEENAVVIANNADALAYDLRTSVPEPVEPGNVIMLIGVVDLDYYGQSDLGKNATPAQLLAALAESASSAFDEQIGPTELVINDRPAASVIFEVEGVSVNFLLVRLAAGTDSPIFGQAVLITGPDEREAFEAVLTAVAESFRLEPA